MSLSPIDSNRSLFEESIHLNSEIGSPLSAFPKSYRHGTSSMRSLSPLRDNSSEANDVSEAFLCGDKAQRPSSKSLSASSIDDTSRYNRPIILDWEEQRNMISRRDFPKKIAIPSSPATLTERMKAFNGQQVKRSTQAPPLFEISDPLFGGNTFASSVSPRSAKSDIDDDSSNGDTPAQILVLSTLETLEVNTAVPIVRTGSTISCESNGIDSTAHVSQFISSPCETADGSLDATSHISQFVSSVTHDRLEETRNISTVHDSSSSVSPRREATTTPKKVSIWTSFESQQQILLQRRRRQAINKVTIPKSPVSLKSRLAAFEANGKQGTLSRDNDDETCSLTSNYSTTSSLW
jgi:hypothetical protein